MPSLTKPRTLLAIGAAVLGVPLLLVVWYWGVERVEVPPGHFMVVINLWGKELPDGEILAPDDSYKGIQLEVKPEGRYYLNPLFHHYEIHSVVNVPQGKSLVRTRKFGKAISAERLAHGDVLAGDGERGVLREAEHEGSYRINPHAYSWEIINTVEIKTNEVGVRTLKIGKDNAELPPQLRAESPYLVPPEYRGVQVTPLSSGVYYLNPHVESVAAVDVSLHTVTFQDIEFPSLDGFTLKPEMTVKYRVLPEKAPELLVTLTDDGHLFQADASQPQQDKNQILQKVVLPVIRGTVRLKGSTFTARQFVSDNAPRWWSAPNPYRQLHEELMRVVPAHCRRVGVEIETINLGQLHAGPELAELAQQVQEREQARLRREANLKEIDKLKVDQQNEADKALAGRAQALVEAKTRNATAEIEATKRLDVEKARLEQDLKNAAVRRDAAKNEAKAILARAEAEAQVIEQRNRAEVAGLRTAIQGFPSPDAYAQYQMTAKLAPALAEIFASDTSDFARMFTQHLTPPNRPAPMGGEDGR